MNAWLQRLPIEHAKGARPCACHPPSVAGCEHERQAEIAAAAANVLLTDLELPPGSYVVDVAVCIRCTCEEP